jgi:hypothetical protein
LFPGIHQDQASLKLPRLSFHYSRGTQKRYSNLAVEGDCVKNRPHYLVSDCHLCSLEITRLTIGFDLSIEHRIAIGTR